MLLFFFEGIISEDSKDLFFRTSDLFIMPSYQEGVSLEGYGITYSEAASYSVPSISGVDGGVKDAVINNYTGWCINPNNENDYCVKSAPELSIILRDKVRLESETVKFGF